MLQSVVVSQTVLLIFKSRLHQEVLLMKISII